MLPPLNPSKQTRKTKEEMAGTRRSKEQERKRKQVKNAAQDEDFAVAEGKTWKETFSEQLPHDRPTWEGKIKMYARWNIKGSCYDTAHASQAMSQKTRSPQTRKHTCSPS
jgi:hypothetical protein